MICPRFRIFGGLLLLVRLQGRTVSAYTYVISTPLDLQKHSDHHCVLHALKWILYIIEEAGLCSNLKSLRSNEYYLFLKPLRDWVSA